jgi:hypothetical protein
MKGDEMEDQKIKADDGKAKLSLVPTEIMYAIARIREYGNNKYPDGGEDNWKSVKPRRYLDAAMRHMLMMRDGEELDPESGYPHLWHLACNVAFLCDFYAKRTGNTAKEADDGRTHMQEV